VLHKVLDRADAIIDVPICSISLRVWTAAAEVVGKWESRLRTDARDQNLITIPVGNPALPPPGKQLPPRLEVVLSLRLV